MVEVCSICVKFWFLVCRLDKNLYNIILYRPRKGSGSFPSWDLELVVGNPKNCEKELV